MTDIPQAHAETYLKFEQEMFELIVKHYPGAIEGDAEPHAGVCAALEVCLGTLLMWRLLRGEEGFKSALEGALINIDSAARTRLAAAQELRKGMIGHYSEGTEKKQ